MFRFEHPEFLSSLILVPVLVGLYFLYTLFRKRGWKAFADEHLREKLQSQFSVFKERTKWGLTVVGFAFICIAFSNPQWGYKKEKVQRQAADVFIALDISTSMLAQDTPPNRIERAKKFAGDLVERLKGERIGLILFAGYGYLQMPLSTDYAAAQLFIKAANTNLAGTQGTAIGDAVEIALRAQPEGEVRNKALIIITDGEDHEENAKEMMIKGKEQGLVPLIVGVGTQEGAFMPINIRGREDYKRDQNGNPVKTYLNEPLMQELAAVGGGAYYSVYNGESALNDLADRINQLEKQDVEQRSFTDFESYFQYFLLIGILLLVIEQFLSRRKGQIRSRISSFKSQAT